MRHTHAKAAKSNRAKCVPMGYSLGSHAPSSATRAEQGSAIQWESREPLKGGHPSSPSLKVPEARETALSEEGGDEISKKGGTECYPLGLCCTLECHPEPLYHLPSQASQSCCDAHHPLLAQLASPAPGSATAVTLTLIFNT